MNRATARLSLMLMAACGEESGALPEEEETLRLLNGHRAAGENCGGIDYAQVAPLSMHGALLGAARAHSLDMAEHGFVGHEGSDGSTFEQRIDAAGYPGQLPWGENVAAGYATPEDVVAGWMGSPGHCANIMEPGFVEIGVGYAFREDSPYGAFWTTDFGGG